MTEWRKNNSSRVSVLAGLHYQNNVNGFGMFTNILQGQTVLLSYQGQFVKNKANGYGIYTLSNRGSYEGE